VKLPDRLRFKRDDVIKAVAFIVIGIAGRLLLLDYANIEPVLAIALLAGMVLPLALAAVVPLVMMGVTDYLIYALNLKGSYGMESIIGLTFFVYTGFLMATLIGRGMRKRLTLKVKNLGVVTLAGIVATVVFDLWTVVGIWYFFTDHSWYQAQVTIVAQVSFTLIHIASSMVFIPLFGSGYILFSEHKTEFSAQAPRDAPEGEARPGV
jgi:hypothetical protein